MNPESPDQFAIATAPHWTAAQVRTILCEAGWLGTGECAPEASGSVALDPWLERAAALLGPHAATPQALKALLELVFHYNHGQVVHDPENQYVLLRTCARDVIRELGNRVLADGDIGSDRFKEIVEEIKIALPYRSRSLFHPIRVALAGRGGEGELDRVILLLDAAAKINFAVKVKGTRQRMLEFCAALD